MDMYIYVEWGLLDIMAGFTIKKFSELNAFEICIHYFIAFIFELLYAYVFHAYMFIYVYTNIIKIHTYVYFYGVFFIFHRLERRSSESRKFSFRIYDSVCKAYFRRSGIYMKILVYVYYL
jgi:hypothetical protein